MAAAAGLISVWWMATYAWECSSMNGVPLLREALSWAVDDRPRVGAEVASTRLGEDDRQLFAAVGREPDEVSGTVQSQRGPGRDTAVPPVGSQPGG